ncbi:MAG: nucleotidyltransferase family protein [Desulfotignum sp.]|nr:nucleotidyltransferase family protein [Desulfotignum sp.]
MPDKSKSCKKPVAGIILAAGCGSRMGTTKQLLPFENTTILGRVTATARASMLDHIILVLGFEAGRIRRSLDLICPDMTGVHMIENPDWKKGQSFSVAAGLNALPPDFSGALFLLGDQPLVMARTINRLVSAFQTTDHWILAPRFQGKRGNPVLVAKPLFSHLACPAGDAGARVLFKEFAHRMQSIAVADAGILRDVDTPEDYKKLAAARDESSTP